MMQILWSCQQGAINCPYYMKTGACKYGVACKFDHPPAGEVMSTKSEGTSAVWDSECKMEKLLSS